MKTAALVVTRRPHHLKWWTHQITKQSRKVDEVIIVSNIEDPRPYADVRRLLDLDDVLFYWQPPQPWVSLGYLRQRALDLATADIVLWFDDDDWYHPRRVERSAALIESGKSDAVFFPLTHVYYTGTQLLHEYPSIAGLSLPASAWLRTKVLHGARFAHVGATEERPWLDSLVHGFPGHRAIVPPPRLVYLTEYVEPHLGGIVVVHGNNTWCYSKRFLYQPSHGRSIQDTPTPLGVRRDEWEWTAREIDSLHARGK